MKAMAGAADPLLQVAVRSSGAAVLVWAYSRLWRRDRWVGAGIAQGRRGRRAFGGRISVRGNWPAPYRFRGCCRCFVYGAIFVAVSLHLFLREERMSQRQWLGCAVSFAGVALVFLAPGDAIAVPGSPRTGAFGALCALLAGLFWGMTTVAVQLSRLSERHSRKRCSISFWGRALRMAGGAA